MTFRNYYDPNYKPDRTASKYKADSKRDAASARETADFVQNFLERWRREPLANEDPAATFQALRTEMRSLKRQSKNKSKFKKSDRKPKNKKRRRRSVSKTGTEVLSTSHEYHPPAPSRPRLKRHSSLKYWKSADEQLLMDYVLCEDKIEAWRMERLQAVNARRKAVLADQIQVQLEIRHDLLTVLQERALSWM